MGLVRCSSLVFCFARWLSESASALAPALAPLAYFDFDFGFSVDCLRVPLDVLGFLGLEELLLLGSPLPGAPPCKD